MELSLNDVGSRLTLIGYKSRGARGFAQSKISPCKFPTSSVTTTSNAQPLAHLHTRIISSSTSLSPFESFATFHVSQSLIEFLVSLDSFCNVLCTQVSSCLSRRSLTQRLHIPKSPTSHRSLQRFLKETTKSCAFLIRSIHPSREEVLWVLS